MSRLAPLDKALVLILVPIWLICFGLGVRTQVLGAAFVQVALSVEDADSYPALTGEFSPVHPFDPLAAAGLRSGDRLIQLGNADLLGVGTLGFSARTVDEAGRDLSVPLVFERNGERLETSLALHTRRPSWSLLAASFVLVATALFLLFRGRPMPTVRAYFYLAMSQAFLTCFFPGSGLELYAWYGIWVAAMSVVFPLVAHLLFVFPDGRAPEGRWHRIWLWFFGVSYGLSFALVFTSRMMIGEIGLRVTLVLALVAMLAVATSKYRRVDLVARRQIRWAILGIYCTALLVSVQEVAPMLDLRFGWLVLTNAWAFIGPLSLVISVLRFNLFDIDRIISATASYNVLVVLFGSGALVVVPRAAEAASALVGIDPGTGQVALSLLLAAAVIPAHRRLRPQIDRLFFKERFALDLGIAELLPTLSHCQNVRALTERVGEDLHRLLRPEACVVYALVEDSYAPVFVEGRAVPPAFAAASPLIGTLAERRKLLALGEAGRRLDKALLGPFDRAALETLQAEVVVPVHLEDALVAFLCLGPKRSGDVYTSTDLSLLAAVAETVSHQLQRFDQDAMIREGREMQASLRRYVPGAVAEQLPSGAELASGEREVSVLFVDIRGYTGFSESRRAEEIFSTVNRYTETVSQIIQRHAGSVVEFHGDGLMAVFGAPRELAHKERAAVEAGREIVEAVAALPVEDGSGVTTHLSVGVGIATGEAFVGNIQAVDRMIWSVIGNTTNLAARLQSLTRELDAALVIDNRTWERAPPAAEDFEKRAQVPIRGRRETQDVYALPMRSDS